MLTFLPRTVSKELLSGLPERSRKVLVDRFGLSSSGESRTLDAIGQEYGITRERIRQIENHSIMTIRQADAYGKHASAWENLKQALHTLGGIVAEDVVLSEVSKTEPDKNHTLFLLTVCHHFNDVREDADFKRRWHIDEQLAKQVEGALMALYKAIALDSLMTESEFLALFEKVLKQEGVKPRGSDVLLRWLSISKRLGKNPLGEWGRTESPHVRIKNTRDFAYLTLKRHGSPMHFSEVAQSIKKLFSREAHPATTHNELIKDSRFVLVGRGLYALKEWGYAPGIVKDVIVGVLEREGGPLNRDEIIERVKRERYVKDATIVVNLQSGPFSRLPDGTYTLRAKK
ncbi:MAG TPA: sigma factor-like helix-turn-helix DNA-binding protein [Candidatus Paceibacterota bacterium]